MGIGSYKEAERYRMRANKNLTRSFYLDTRRTLDDEPFAWEQPQDAGIMQPETVQEFADGGRVGFKDGSKLKGVIGSERFNYYKEIGDPNIKKPTATLRGFGSNKWPDKETKNFYENQIKERFKYAKNSSELSEKYNSGELLTNEQLAKKYNISIPVVKRLNKRIVKDFELKDKPVIGREESLKKRDVERRKAQLKFSNPYFEQKMAGTYEAHLGHMGDLYNRMVTAKNLGYTPMEINDAMKETLDPILKNISRKQDELIKNKPSNWKTNKKWKEKLYEYNQKGINYSSLAEGYKSFDIINPNTLEKYSYGVDYLKTIDPAFLYKGKSIKEIAELTDKREINKIQKAFDDLTEAKKTARAEGLEQADISKIKNSELLTEENLKKLQTYKAFEENREAVMKAQTKVPESEKTKIINNLTNYLNKNPEEIKILKDVGIPCRRSTGGKVDVECLAENVVKEVEKLETGTDLQKTSALTKFKNATKLGSGLAEEFIGFGKGAAGRTLGPLAALNSALEQWTSGNYREGLRKIGSLVDLTTLVGDPLGFEKMRTEGTIEDVRGKIGKENQASLDRLLEFKDKYYQLQDINTKLERAESSAAGQYDPESVGIDQNYINELKKQQTDLNKIINNKKYQNIRDDYLNVGNAVKNEIFKRNIGAPEQNKYVFETAAQEQLKSIFGEDFYDELSDENKTIFKNLTTSEEIQPVYSETPIQSPDDSMREGFKDGTEDPNEKPVIPIDPLSDEMKPTNIMDTKLTRRQVIGGIGAAAGVPIVAKLIKEGKATKAAQATKAASKIKIEPAEGMYEWFPKLVEKVKKMGEPLEEKERLMVPSYKNDPRPFISRMPTGEEKLTKHIDGDTTFILREYPDGRIAVDIDSPRNQESFGQSVSLYYRPKMEFKNYKGEVKMEPAEFKVIEPEPQYFANGPDDVDITFQEVPKNPNRSVVYADIEAAERFATGKIKNRKIIPVKQSLRNEMEEEPSTFIMRQSGELGSKAEPEELIKSSGDILKLPE